MRRIIFLTLLIVTINVSGQNLFNQSTIYIGPTGILFVTDDLVNNSLIVNNGDLQVGGAWINNNQYDAGTGKITFNGNQPQTINHNAQSFSRLTVSGGGIKTFSTDITIVNELDLQSGLLVSQNNSRILFGQDAVIIGGSDQSHINGTVYQQGIGVKLFPTGNGIQYLPAEILGIGSASEIGITLVEFPTLQSFDFRPELSNVSGKRFWEVDVVSGSLTGTQLSLPVKGDEGLFGSTAQYEVTQSADSPIEFESLGQFEFTGSTSDGTVTSNNAASANLVSVVVVSLRIIYNAISDNRDARNPMMKINNITSYPNNKVTVFNRWGDKVFEIRGYDNAQKVFTGDSNVGGNSELPPGTYFYTIDKGDGSPAMNGYLSLRR